MVIFFRLVKPPFKPGDVEVEKFAEFRLKELDVKVFCSG